MSVEPVEPVPAGRSVKSFETPWRRLPLAGLWRRFGPERVRRRADERDRAIDDAYQAGEIRWQWREASIGAGLGQLVFTPSGPTVSVPVVTRVDLRPTTTLTVRLRPGQLARDVAAVQQRLASLMGKQWIRVTPRAAGLVTVELW
jgi:hypothetical protein